MLTMTRIGTQIEAETALALFDESGYTQFGDATDVDSESMRDGWEILCSGTNRLCFLSPDKTTVYKIQYDQDDYSNITEWTNYKRLNAKRWSRFRIAHCSYYLSGSRNVIAMEYVPGAFCKELSLRLEISTETDVSDIWLKNVIVPYDGSLPVLIDMGE